MNNFLVTHIVKEEPPLNDELRRLSFITKLNDKNEYFIGFGIQSPFTKEDLLSKIESGSLIALFKPIQINKTQGLWLDSNSNIWIANKQNPNGDVNKIKVLDVPDNTICPDCKGTGDLSGKSQNIYEECPKCEGSGQL